MIESQQNKASKFSTKLWISKLEKSVTENYLR